MSAAKESNNKVLLRLRPRQDEARRANKVKNKVMKNVAENKAHQIREPTRRQSVSMSVCVCCMYVCLVWCVLLLFLLQGIRIKDIIIFFIKVSNNDKNYNKSERRAQ